MLIWWLIPETTNAHQWIRRHDRRMILPRYAIDPEQQLDRANNSVPRWLKSVRFHACKALRWSEKATLRDQIEMAFLRLWDVANSIWLAYLVCAQTFGADQNCDCWSSNWGHTGVSTRRSNRVAPN